MNINYKQPQFELFPAKASAYDDVNKPRFFLANLTLSFESLVILSILGIMVALFSFCIGVEWGKRAAAQVLDERVSAAWNLAGKRPMAKTALTAVRPVAVAALPLKVNAGYVAGAPRAQAHAVPSAAAQKPAVRPVIAKPAAVQPAATTGLPAGQAGTRFTLQLASYTNEEYARIEAAALRAKGYRSFLIKRSDYILVCIGQFINAEAAGAELKKLPPHYRTAQLRRF